MSIVSHNKCKKCKDISLSSNFQRDIDYGYICIDQSMCESRKKAVDAENKRKRT